MTDITINTSNSFCTVSFEIGDIYAVGCGDTVKEAYQAAWSDFRKEVRADDDYQNYAKCVGEKAVGYEAWWTLNRELEQLEAQYNNGVMQVGRSWYPGKPTLSIKESQLNAIHAKLEKIEAQLGY